jgi:hypothetical protein
MFYVWFVDDMVKHEIRRKETCKYCPPPPGTAMSIKADIYIKRRI